MPQPKSQGGIARDRYDAVLLDLDGGILGFWLGLAPLSASRSRRLDHQIPPPDSRVSSVPQRLQWTASLSWSESPQREQLWCILLGRNRTCTIRTNKLTPTIIMTIESNRPEVPVSVMSPNPVVVSVATVR